MRWLWRILAGILLLLLLLGLLAGGVVAGLNTAPGRGLAVRAVNHFAGPSLQISGLAGHFPADIKLGAVQLADANGVWLHAADLELRWAPLEVLQRHVDVQALRAAQINVLRAPVSQGKPGGGGGGLPKLRLDVDALTIGALRLPASLAGQDVVLHVQAAAHLRDLAHGQVVLDATTPEGAAQYHVAALIDPQNVNLALHVAEPPGGPLGHFAGPRVQGPLMVQVTLLGPRDAAALHFAAALGAAQLQGDGTLGLNPAKPFADVNLRAPALAPFGRLAGEAVSGAAQLHLVVAPAGRHAASLAMDGSVALRQVPDNLGKFLGAQDHFVLRARLAGGAVDIAQFDVGGANFAAYVSGRVTQKALALATKIDISQVSALSPGIAGSLAAQGSITGGFKDFAVHEALTGRISARAAPAGPFNITLDVAHLPGAPAGAVAGSGVLEDAPLQLDASFSRGGDGIAHVEIRQAAWRSLTAEAALQMAPGALLPTGTARFAVGRLQDFAAFVPLPLRGAAHGDFTYGAGQTVQLNLTAQGVTIAPALGPVNGTLAASGPLTALGVKTAFTVARVQGGAARVGLAGVLDVPAKSARLDRFSGAWRGLNAVLQGPAGITTQPQVAVQHLRLRLAGARIALDGALYPRLAAQAAVQDLPVSLVTLFAPAYAATGTLSGTANLTGAPSAPAGSITLQAAGLHLQQGAAAALPPASINGKAVLHGQSADVAVQLAAGQDIALNVQGLAPLRSGGAMNLRLRGTLDLRLLDAYLAAQGTDVRGAAAADLGITGTLQNPAATGSLTLRDGSVENIGSGLNLTKLSADVAAAGQKLTLQDFAATAGQGSLSAHGTVSLAGQMPVDLALHAAGAQPISSDILTETLDGDVALTGALKGGMALSGNIKIGKADINIPHGLPASVADLPIITAGAPPPPPATPAPPITLAVDVRARNQIFVRGDGLFAELGGHLRIGGTAAAPDPEGGFTLIRGNFSLAGTSLQFTQGTISFTGAGFMPTLDLEATASSATVSGATLTVGGTAAKPVITLSSTPPMPSDEILATLLFGQSTSSLTPFQAASLAAALAQISGIGGGVNPLDKVRSALGLDQLSLGGTGTGPPSLQAGRYVTPGVYVGATQAANGQGTQVNVEVNLYKGLKLDTATGTGSGSSSSSVGLSYQFNY